MFSVRSATQGSRSRHDRLFENTETEALVELPIAPGQDSYEVKLDSGTYIAMLGYRTSRKEGYTLEQYLVG